MPIALEITLIAALAAVTVSLVPLLIQLSRTARGVEVFLRSAQRDLAQLADDTHASRERVDDLAASLQVSLDEFAALSRTLGDVGRMVKALQEQFQPGLHKASRVIGNLLGGLDSVRAFFGRKPQPTE
jgi:ABC-type transporter Mla subunit MlaD